MILISARRCMIKGINRLRMADRGATISIGLVFTSEVSLLNNNRLVVLASLHLHLLLSYVFLESDQY